MGCVFFFFFLCHPPPPFLPSPPSSSSTSAIRQDFWPPLFRLARLVPAPDYVSAQRARSVLAAEVAAAFARPSSPSPTVHAFIGNGTDLLAAANLVGLPSVAAPLALVPVPGATPTSPRRVVTSVGFFAPPHDDAVVLALAAAWQAASTAHRQRPPVGEVDDAVKRRACDRWSRCAFLSGGGVAGVPSA